ncbi:Phosphoenolpyruvate carboxykinase [ATP] 1 [Candidatus Bipolaricaulis anaerobius]|uniref:Phosphoenolpyruvate carboxykinase (ATP) n=1 Tax=Candidatus Bipolaricaulis anaerobius TaxID=2026885 RepID=A0A2X3KTM3_9BACT|nr:phosphoenolpyruvate carboxykinase (ATP) [Candidatus Bipolaricaulis anaerobius]SQD92028.1 Phosphoenolpyruvate carboxykinase [ATP] 1 [Candidatus Bipolaricaulis anaerobius]
MDINREVERLVGARASVNPSRPTLVQEAIAHREALVSVSGALATWTSPESTGRRPQDTYIVDRPEIHDEVDWTSPYCIPMAPATFELLASDAVATLAAKPRLFLMERALGADPACALPVRLLTDRALTALFADNMFRPLPTGIERSPFADRPFTLLALPYNKLDPRKYAGRLRNDPDKGRPSDLAVVMDFALRVGIVYGSAYLGSVKKLLFTVMNFLLPPLGILPLHGAANVGADGRSALFLGLSGTGKTSLSSDPERALLGDDEHGWSEEGIFNFEWGCYAKMIGIDPAKEPDIYGAVMHEAPPEDHGAIVENAFITPDGRFDFHDRRLTENSRASYPLSFIHNSDPTGRAGHPTVMVFLTADANGVLPPIARLEPDQAKLWFLMGYTSKLAGTETGVAEPGSTFSRFFGAPFMPRLPHAYTDLLGEYLDRYKTRTWLVNTGWSGGPYREGSRIDIRLTRAMVRAALSGELDRAKFTLDERFHLWVPTTCPGVPEEILRPEATWKDRGAYSRRADLLAHDFAREFEKSFGSLSINPRVAAQCPGRR